MDNDDEIVDSDELLDEEEELYITTEILELSEKLGIDAKVLYEHILEVSLENALRHGGDMEAPYDDDIAQRIDDFLNSHQQKNAAYDV